MSSSFIKAALLRHRLAPKAARESYHDFVLSVFCVKVWRRMITKVHFDADAKEPANFRHTEATPVTVGICPPVFCQSALDKLRLDTYQSDHSRQSHHQLNLPTANLLLAF